MTIYKKFVEDVVLTYLAENENTNKKIGYNKLKNILVKPKKNSNENIHMCNNFCESYGHVSSATFAFHIKKLLDKDLISRKQNEIGKQGHYYRTDKAKFLINFSLYPLETINRNVENKQGVEMARGQLLYHLLFYLMSKQNPEKRFESKKHFENFLDRLDKVRISALEIEEPKFKPKYRLGYFTEDNYYDDIWITRYKPIKNVMIRREDYNFFILRNKSDHHSIYRRQEVETRLKTEKGKKGHAYICIIPGISENISLNSRIPVFRYLGFSKSEIVKGIENLTKKQWIHPILMIGNEIIYGFKDPKLKMLFVEYWSLFNSVNRMMRCIWKNFRKPTEEECNWFYIFYGKRQTDEMFRMFHQDRQSLKQIPENKRKERLSKVLENIEGVDLAVSEKFTVIDSTLSEIIKKYGFPTTILRDLLFPKFIENINIDKIKNM